jgi:hypothetical protein
MRLEDVTATIRPRARWESIDLGCAMVRRSYGTILLVWLVCVWPLWIAGVIGFGMISEGGWHLWWSTLWIWLSLGIAGKLPLHIISRELFGEKVSAWGVIRLWPRMLFTNIWQGIISRFTMSRGLSMPVSQLEGLKGKAYKVRVNLLIRNGGDGATQAVLVSHLMIIVLSFACWFFIMMVYGFYGESDVLEQLFEDLYIHGDDYSTSWMFLLFYCIAVSLVEPLFVGAGFAMYVNSRTLTEGWDIELSFKRMSERLRGNFVKKSTHLLLIICGLSFFSISDASAETARERAERITSEEEYTVHQRQEQEEIKASSRNSSRSFSGGAGDVFKGIFSLLFWAIVIAVVGLLIWVILKNRHALNKTNSLDEVHDIPVVKSVMGMDVTPESLPLALADEARAAWLRGDHQLAMSLLYRGAISWMVNQGRVPILESDTENDCVRRVREYMIASDRERFFSNLTENWIGLAYGKNLPQESEVMSMCEHWPFKIEGGKR